MEVRSCPRRVDLLVVGSGRGNKARKLRDEIHHVRAEAVHCHRAPAFVVPPPHARTSAGPSGRYEAGEDRPLWMSCRDSHDVGQHPTEPWRLPLGVLGEHPLHVDAQVDRIVPGRPSRRRSFSVIFRSLVSTSWKIDATSGSLRRSLADSRLDARQQDNRNRHTSDRLTAAACRKESAWKAPSSQNSTPDARRNLRSSTSSRNAGFRGAISSCSLRAPPTLAGADAKAAPAPEQSGKLKGPIKVSVDLQGDDPKRVADALKGTGAKAVRTK